VLSVSCLMFSLCTVPSAQLASAHHAKRRKQGSLPLTVTEPQGSFNGLKCPNNKHLGGEIGEEGEGLLAEGRAEAQEEFLSGLLLPSLPPHPPQSFGRGALFPRRSKSTTTVTTRAGNTAGEPTAARSAVARKGTTWFHGLWFQPRQRAITLVDPTGTLARVCRTRQTG
jgi:hypothetical protein